LQCFLDLEVTDQSYLHITQSFARGFWFSKLHITLSNEIPSSVEKIGDCGFFSCTSLNEIVFSSGSHLREISGFQHCTSLCRIEIPSSVVKIGDWGFYCCTSLNELIFSFDSHLREISGFCKCTSLCRIEIPSSVEKIGNPAVDVGGGFHGCISLNEVVFSSDSHLKGIDGFGKCTSLCRIEIPSSIDKICISGFLGCTSLNELIFLSDNHLKQIDGFYECTSLCRIEIPSSVEKIENNGFFECTSMKEVIFSRESHLRELEGFHKCTSLYRIEIPSSVMMLGHTGFFRWPSLRIVVIDGGIRLKINRGLSPMKLFLIYEDSEKKTGRRQIHLSLGGGRRKRRS
jgi:hypothetical protein